MSSDSIEGRALELIRREDEANEERAEQEEKARERSRLEEARRTIRRQDREVEAAQDRRLAAREAEDLADELAALGEVLQRQAEMHLHAIEDYAELRGRLMDARRRSGNPVEGRAAKTRPILEGHHRSVFGGHGSLVGVPHEQSGQLAAGLREGRTLPQRDPLASRGTD